MSRVFAIDHHVWEESIWKTLNFFLVLRCGYEVPGKHRACHSDMLLKNGDEAIVANGGWHDAADLAQGMHNTAEATSALLALSLALKDRNPRLHSRVLEEAKWGLDYVLKMRFSDGRRSSYSSSSIWTDGIIGTKDDIVSRPGRSAWLCFDCAYTEALGAKVFAEIDPNYAKYCAKTAAEDFKFAEIYIEERKALGGTIPMRSRGSFRNRNQSPFPPSDYIDIQVSSFGAMAAAALFTATKNDFYAERAKVYADMVIACQQQEYTDWDVPMVGFFYQDLERNVIWHASHMSYTCMPDIALREMCETFPNDADYMKWYYALALSGEYYKTLMKYSQPYGMVPAGVYHEDELDKYPAKVLAGVNQIREEDYPLYREMVHKGFPVGKGHYVRLFPVWFSFRGNYQVTLSQSKSMSCAALLRNDYDLYQASQDNYAFIVGKNPFSQSTMTGEGYDYSQLYAVQPGQTVGALPVGMQSHFEDDVAYWPQVNTATYKEVWVCPPTKWMWCMADNHLPAVVEGYLAPKHGKLTFKHEKSGMIRECELHPHTGYFKAILPAGKYTVCDSLGTVRENYMVISGKKYSFNGTFYGLNMSVQNGSDVEIRLSVNCNKDMLPDSAGLVIRAENLTGFPEETSFTSPITIKVKVVNPNKPWVMLVHPAFNPSDVHEIFGGR